MVPLLKHTKGKTHTKNDIDTFKFKSSNLQTNQKHFEGELNSSFILEFVQYNS